MNIEEACQTIRQAYDFAERRAQLVPTMELHGALQVLKRFIEVKEGGPIAALGGRDDLLGTRRGLRYLLPYVTAVEAQLGR